jgi:branched-chain amino acid transport system substrate-binding protein
MSFKPRWIASVIVCAFVATGLSACRGGSSSDASGTSSSGICPDTTPGLTNNSIKLGGSYPLSGPLASFGAWAVGAKVWFEHLNDTQGGFDVDGKKLKITWDYLDDAYAPARALQNTRNLVENKKVFAMFNSFGTGTAIAARGYLNQQKVPQLFVGSGADQIALQGQKFPWTVPYIVPYSLEAKLWAKYLIDKDPNYKIGILYSNDDFGKSHLGGLKAGLGDKAKSMLVAEESYETTDTNINSQISQMKAKGADVVYAAVSGIYAPQSIKRTAQIGWKPKQFILVRGNASVGTTIDPAGRQNSVGVTSASYLKDPNDAVQAKDPAIIEYKSLLKKYEPSADPTKTEYEEGMAVAQTLQNAVESVKGPLCRQTLIDTIKKTELSAPLYPAGLKSTMPLAKMQAIQWDGDRWKPIGTTLTVGK